MERKNPNRMDRINEELKREISNIINYEMKNSNVTGLISVTKVSTSPDLRNAKVHVSFINSKSVKNALAGLKASSGFVRSEIAKKLNLRVTPEITFELDATMENAQKIDMILQDIMKDVEPK